MEVILHVYDVTNSASVTTNNTILKINNIFKDAIGLGGLFHGAIQVYGDEEWSFGYSEQGTGVFPSPAANNPMYTFRESIELGQTSFSRSEVNQILREMSREWPGNSYNLLAKNCNHFCDELCVRLRVAKLPAWVNRFANAGDVAGKIAGETVHRLQQAKTEIVTAGKVAYRYLAGIESDVTPGNSSGTRGSEPSWFQNLITSCAKPATSSQHDEEERRQVEESPSTDNGDDA